MNFYIDSEVHYKVKNDLEAQINKLKDLLVEKEKEINILKRQLEQRGNIVDVVDTLVPIIDPKAEFITESAPDWLKEQNASLLQRICGLIEVADHRFNDKYRGSGGMAKLLQIHVTEQEMEAFINLCPYPIKEEGKKKKIRSFPASDEEREYIQWEIKEEEDLNTFLRSFKKHNIQMRKTSYLYDGGKAKVQVDSEKIRDINLNGTMKDMLNYRQEVRRQHNWGNKRISELKLEIKLGRFQVRKVENEKKRKYQKIHKNAAWTITYHKNIWSKSKIGVLKFNFCYMIYKDGFPEYN